MLKYLLKTTWRYRTRSLLTVSGAAVAMFVFCFVGSIQQGLRGLTSGQDAERRLIVFQENRFCPSTSRLPEDYADRIRAIDGVSDVIPVQVWTNNCRASLDIVVFNGAAPEQIRASRPITLSGNRWDEFLSRRDAAIVGQNIARRRNLRPGDQFSIGGISVHVADIFRSEVPQEDNLVYTNLEFLQYSRGVDAAGLVTQHEVILAESADPDRVADEIDRRFGSAAVATNTRRKGAFQASTLSDLVDLVEFSHWLGYACVVLVLSIVATTTLMNVQDRMKEYAILETIGMRPGVTLRLVIVESTMLCIAGGLTGTISAVAMLWLNGFAIGAEGATIAMQPSWVLVATGSAVSFLIGVVGGVAPAIQASTVPIVQSLRQT